MSDDCREEFFAFIEIYNSSVGESLTKWYYPDVGIEVQLRFMSEAP
jgi:hypothetical protein